MSEDEQKRDQEEQGDEVDAHAKVKLANEEPAAEGEGDDEVEAHVHRKL